MVPMDTGAPHPPLPASGQLQARVTGFTLALDATRASVGLRSPEPGYPRLAAWGREGLGPPTYYRRPGGRLPLARRSSTCWVLVGGTLPDRTRALWAALHVRWLRLDAWPHAERGPPLRRPDTRTAERGQVSVDCSPTTACVAGRALAMHRRSGAAPCCRSPSSSPFPRPWLAAYSLPTVNASHGPAPGPSQGKAAALDPPLSVRALQPQRRRRRTQENGKQEGHQSPQRKDPKLHAPKSEQPRLEI